MENEKNYPNYLKYLFDCAEAISLQENSKCLVLEVIYCTVREFYWIHLVEYLMKNLYVLEKIGLLNFAETCFSLKQLLDCYQLFKKCQEEKFRFPKIFIDGSIAGIQLIRSKDIREEEENKQLEKKLRDSKGFKIYPGRPDDLIEPLLDIRREEFVKGIIKDNVVDKSFLQHLYLLDGSLFDYWNQGWLV